MRIISIEYGVFMHCKEKKFTDFIEIRNEIERQTDEIAGKNKGISSTPINLHIYSPNVVDLTLIDLPGVTKIPIGDEPADIENLIKELSRSYISKDNCLILAVTRANDQLTVSDALILAEEVDPKKIRTIGVLTHLDVMVDGTDARDILENKVLPLPRGYVGVVNRSQADIKNKKHISAALEYERNFFMENENYRHIADRMGIPYLQRMLNKQLTEHIAKKLPSVYNELSKIMISLENEIKQFNISLRDDADAMKKQMIRYSQWI